MPKISPFQMTEAQSWAGLTTKNHLGAIYQSKPQMASKLMTRIAQTNFGLDLDSYLDVLVDDKPKSKHRREKKLKKQLIEDDLPPLFVPPLK